MDDASANAAGANGFHVEDVPASDLRAMMKAVRQIVRANDLQSKALARASGLTAPQLVVLTGVAELGEVTTNALSDYADLSPATVVMIVENLEGRAIVERYRATTDRRVVYTRLTPKGREMVAATPGLFGPEFSSRFAALPRDRRRAIMEGLTEAARLMGRD